MSRPAREDGTDTQWVFHASETDVFDALARGTHAAGLREYFGTAAHAELSMLAAAAQRIERPAGPRVLILPGIMGSRLGTAAPSPHVPELLWIDPVQIGGGRLKALVLPPDELVADLPIEPMGVLLQAYARLILKLRIAGCRPSFHAYDWRLGIDELGSALARRIAAADEPVNLIAHSMGGLIARVAAGLLPTRLLRKLIMLGTPNHGSFAPVQALRGTHPFVRQISSLDRQHSADALAAGVFNTFPGIYHLLPPRRGGEKLDLLDAGVWPVDGPMPLRHLLGQVKAARAHLAAPDSRMSHIIGVNQTTVVTVRRTAAGFEYGSNSNGDGTVPVARANMQRLQAYYVDESHGNLPGNLKVIRAIIDLLRRGRTRALPARWTPQRGALLRTDDARLALAHNEKIDWRTLNSAQREAALGELDRSSPRPSRAG